MFPWVARQWHVLTLSRAVLGRPCCTRHGRAAVHHPSLRAFAHQADQNGTPAPISSAYRSAIIIPSAVAAIQPDDLTKYIEPLDIQYRSKDRLAVFFVTPAFATWLLDGRTFLQKALHRVFKRLVEANQYGKVHALVAVVDKMPTPQSIDNGGNIKEGALYRMRNLPASETGLEGIAYTTLPFSDARYTPRTSQDDHGSVRFLTSSGLEDEEGFCQDSLRLPLANTVFQTGSPTTMSCSTWEMHQDTPELVMTTMSDLSELSLRLHRTTHAEPQSTLAIPLIPLTVPRQVEAVMGNIVRRVIGADGKSSTASEELEKVVPQYFNARKEPSQAISVWALVIPRDVLESVSLGMQRLFSHAQAQQGIADLDPNTFPWADLWGSAPPIWNDLVTMALSEGARLHRVLSGGGGWGKKAGLLSLDPSAIAETLATSQVEEFDASEDELQDLSTALQEVVQSGDSVQFFASPSAKTTFQKDSAKAIERLRRLSSKSTPWMWEFGTIPSTADVVQASSSQHDTSVSKEVFVFRNSFGALTEGGMTIQRRYKPNVAQSVAAVSTSKIDVPFSQFGLVNSASVAGEGSDLEEASMRDFMQSPNLRSDASLSTRSYSNRKPPLLKLPLVTRSPEHLEAMPRIRKHAVHDPKTLTEESSDLIRKFKVKNVDSRFLTVNKEPAFRRPNFLRVPSILHSPPVEVDGSTTSVTDQKEVHQALHNAGQRGTKALEAAAHHSDGNFYKLQRDLLNRIAGMKPVPVTVLEFIGNETSIVVDELRVEARRLEDFIDLRAQLAAATNNSAINIYLHHTFTRWRISAMIEARKIWTTEVQFMKKKLGYMRAFNKNLFVYFNAPHPRYLEEKLNALEQQKPEMAPLLGLPAARRVKDGHRVLKGPGGKLRIRRLQGRTVGSKLSVRFHESQATRTEHLASRLAGEREDRMIFLGRRSRRFGKVRNFAGPKPRRRLSVRDRDRDGGTRTLRKVNAMEARENLVNQVRGWLGGL